MRHLKKGRKFGRESSQRRALMKSLASSFFVLGKIKTTEAKAKELQRFAERHITRAQNPDVVDIRRLRSFFSGHVVKRLIEEAKAQGGRRGGFTRITKLGARKSDSARMAIIEFVK